MNEFIISYNKIKSGQIIGLLAGAYLTIFFIYYVIVKIMANDFDFIFYLYAFGLVLGILLIIQNTLLRKKLFVRIDNNVINLNIHSQNNTLIDWTNVSQVNVGVSYIVFILNGQKQAKIDLSSLTYNDLKDTKSKIIEVCEYKNIPYKND